MRTKESSHHLAIGPHLAHCIGGLPAVAFPFPVQDGSLNVSNATTQKLIQVDDLYLDFGTVWQANLD